MEQLELQQDQRGQYYTGSNCKLSEQERCDSEGEDESNDSGSRRVGSRRVLSLQSLQSKAFT